MTDPKKDVPTVTAPVLVVQAAVPVPNTAPTVLDTGQFKAMYDKMTNQLIITPKETAEVATLKRQWEIEYLQKQQLAHAIPVASNTPYVMMALIMVVVVVISIVMLETFSIEGKDNSATIAQIIGFAATFTAALFAYQKGQDTHKMVNSQLSTWIAKTEAEALQRGEIAGRDKANVRADMQAEKAAATKTESPGNPPVE